MRGHNRLVLHLGPLRLNRMPWAVRHKPALLAGELVLLLALGLLSGFSLNLFLEELGLFLE